jgi:tetratricopeptide (TPR) repeat protein
VSEQYQRVEPTPFDAPEQITVPPVETATGAESRWLIPALGVLVVLALAVVFILPAWVGDREAAGGNSAPSADASTSQSPTTTANNASKPGEAAAASPFADALEAKARAEAQALLGELLDVQENLNERGAQSWAPEEMESVAAQALTGDERYRERDFAAAIEAYQKALEEALTLEQTLPTRFATQLEITRTAIEALDVEAAASGLELAERLEPGAPESAQLAERVDALAAVAAAVDAGLAAEAENDLARAVEQFGQAAALDPAHEYVSSEWQRLQQALNDAQFNAAMSEGYAALDDGDFERAKQRFDRAGALQPGSDEAAAALQELNVARTADKLNRLQRRGDAAIASEDWAAAIKAFEEALAVDQSLRFARDGLAIAQPRARASKELQAILDAPERLVDDAILREARASLERARGLENTGPKMAAMIQDASETLRVASTPLDVDIRSDGLTEVTVYKVARLGLLEATTLSLRPGQYTAVGSRRGYRDVRVVFTVAPDAASSVYIACNEAI